MNQNVSLLVGLLSIGGSIVIGVRFLVKHYFKEIRDELRPNSGKSLKDQVSRLEAKVELIYDLVVATKSKRK